MAIEMAGLSEALALGASMGIDPAKLTEVMNTSSARCWASDSYNPVPVSAFDVRAVGADVWLCLSVFAVVVCVYGVSVARCAFLLVLLFCCCVAQHVKLCAQQLHVNTATGFEELLLTSHPLSTVANYFQCCHPCLLSHRLVPSPPPTYTLNSATHRV